MEAIKISVSNSLKHSCLVEDTPKYKNTKKKDASYLSCVQIQWGVGLKSRDMGATKEKKCAQLSKKC